MFDIHNVINAIEDQYYIPDENKTIYFLDYDIYFPVHDGDIYFSCISLTPSNSSMERVLNIRVGGVTDISYNPTIIIDYSRIQKKFPQYLFGLENLITGSVGTQAIVGITGSTGYNTIGNASSFLEYSIVRGDGSYQLYLYLLAPAPDTISIIDFYLDLYIRDGVTLSNQGNFIRQYVANINNCLFQNPGTIDNTPLTTILTLYLGYNVPVSVLKTFYPNDIILLNLMACNSLLPDDLKIPDVNSLQLNIGYIAGFGINPEDLPPTTRPSQYPDNYNSYNLLLHLLFEMTMFFMICPKGRIIVLISKNLSLPQPPDLFRSNEYSVQKIIDNVSNYNAASISQLISLYFNVIAYSSDPNSLAIPSIFETFAEFTKNNKSKIFSIASGNSGKTTINTDWRLQNQQNMIYLGTLIFKTPSVIYTSSLSFVANGLIYSSSFNDGGYGYTNSYLYPTVLFDVDIMDEQLSSNLVYSNIGGTAFKGIPDFAFIGEDIKFIPSLYPDNNNTFKVMDIKGTSFTPQQATALSFIVMGLTKYTKWEFREIYYRKANSLFTYVSNGQNSIYSCGDFNYWNPVSGLGYINSQKLVSLTADIYNNNKLQVGFKIQGQYPLCYINILQGNPFGSELYALTILDQQPVLGCSSIFSIIVIKYVNNSDITRRLYDGIYVYFLTIDEQYAITLGKDGGDKSYLYLSRFNDTNDDKKWVLSKGATGDDTFIRVFDGITIQSVETGEYMTCQFNANGSSKPSCPSLTTISDPRYTTCFLGREYYDDAYYRAIQIALDPTKYSYYINIAATTIFSDGAENTTQEIFLQNGEITHSSGPTAIYSARQNLFTTPVNPIFKKFSPYPEWIFIPYYVSETGLVKEQDYLIFNTLLNAYLYLDINLPGLVSYVLVPMSADFFNTAQNPNILFRFLFRMTFTENTPMALENFNFLFTSSPFINGNLFNQVLSANTTSKTSQYPWTGTNYTYYSFDYSQADPIQSRLHVLIQEGQKNSSFRGDMDKITFYWVNQGSIVSIRDQIVLINNDINKTDGIGGYASQKYQKTKKSVKEVPNLIYSPSSTDIQTYCKWAIVTANDTDLTNGYLYSYEKESDYNNRIQIIAISTPNPSFYGQLIVTSGSLPVSLHATLIVDQTDTWSYLHTNAVILTDANVNGNYVYTNTPFYLYNGNANKNFLSKGTINPDYIKTDMGQYSENNTIIYGVEDGGGLWLFKKL